MRKMNFKKSAAVILSTVCMVTALVGCGSSSADNGADADSNLSGSITAAGSSALKPLVDDAADLFNEKYPDVNITIDAGGSGEGLKQVSEGTVNIGNSDVEAAEKLDAAKAAELVDHKVCVVTMAPIVNKDVTAGGVKNLTKAQLTDIFTGKITNWKEVGGADEAIVLITRPESSGTRATFKKYALDGASEASNKYEHMYTKGNADEVSQKFLDYITSDEYGKKMESLGYGVSSKMTVKEH